MSSSSTQFARHAAVATPLGEDALRLADMQVVERLSTPFEIELTLASKREDIDHETMLGQNVTARVDVERETRPVRFFNGYVTRFAYLGRDQDYVHYSASLRPWLWFLSRTSDCRIFQGKSVPQIVATVFSGQGFTDVEDRLTASYPALEYCVQYRESDLDFVARLLQREGIYYFFRHDNGRHTLVLADDYASHEVSPGFERVPWFPPSANLVREDHFASWSGAREVRSGAVRLRDFDFRRPRADLAVRAIVEREHANAGFSQYDYPGLYTSLGRGEALATRRMQSEAARHGQVRASGNVRGLGAGDLFTLEGHPRAAENIEYLVTAAHLDVSNNDYASGSAAAGGASVHCAVEVMDASQPYRAPLDAPPRIMPGPQTAVVTGPTGEEIWTDEYGRVKLQFHWDRNASGNEHSSCWVRVAQVSAGRGWGAMTLPRVGQEVIVDFLEGDPDQPIVTGRIYNGDNMPPYALPANATVSTFKSNSSKGGGGFNELRFEDRKGAEQVFMHAERDHDLRVKNDQREWVGNEAHRIVTSNSYTRCDADVHQTTQGDLMARVAGNASLTVERESHERVGSTYALDVGSQVHIKAGSQIVLEAGSSVTLKVGGSFLNVTPSGIFGSAGQVNLNSGGSAAKGAGAEPVLPDDAAVADDAIAGDVAEPPAGRSAPEDAFTAQSVSALVRARDTSAPYCEICNAE